MSAEENKEIALSLLEALNARDLSLWSQHLAEAYIAELPGVSVPLDKTRSMEYQQRFVTALPDIHFEVLRILIHWTGSGTHAERPVRRVGGMVSPVTVGVRVSGALLTEVRDGKIVGEWSYWDQLSLLAQLGITDQTRLFLSPEGF